MQAFILLNDVEALCYKESLDNENTKQTLSNIIQCKKLFNAPGSAKFSKEVDQIFLGYQPYNLAKITSISRNICPHHQGLM
jgi:hypothetical protein